MTPEEHARIAVAKLSEKRLQVSFFHSKVIVETIQSALEEQRAGLEAEAMSKVEASVAEARAECDRWQALVTDLRQDIEKATERERTLALAPAVAYREQLERLLDAVLKHPASGSGDMSKLWIEVARTKDLLKCEAGREILERLRAHEEAVKGDA